MNILITGGCGFLGSNVAASYLQEGSKVTIIDAMLKKGCWENLQWLGQISKDPRSLEFIQADLADLGAIEDVFYRHSPFDYICHFAGQVAMTFSLSDPIKDFQANALGTINLLEVSRKRSPNCLFAFSS
ncbi:MAG: GDP-mannose 4,6-dehydratase, partial [Pirellula sp.]